MKELDLSYVSSFLYDMAVEEWEKGDIDGLLCLMNNTVLMEFVRDNMGLLQERGLYEQALLHAYVATKTNLCHIPVFWQGLMWDLCDRETLRRIAPVPQAEKYRLYRGVAGMGPWRHVKGMSWTADFEQADWYSHRFDLPDPAVYTITLPDDRHILAYTQERNEDEYICLLPYNVRPRRVREEAA